MTSKTSSITTPEPGQRPAAVASSELAEVSLRQPVDPFERLPDGGVVFEESGAALGLDDSEGELVEGADPGEHESPPGPLEPPTADEIVREDMARALARQ